MRENRTDKCLLKTATELTKEPRGFLDYRYDIQWDVLLLRWNDNKCIIVASNYDKIAPLAKASSWKREANGLKLDFDTVTVKVK